MKNVKALNVLFGLLLIGNSAISQGLNNEVIRANMLVDWERAKVYTKEYLDAMPESGINFKPKADMRSFAEQMLHMSQSTMTVISIATGAEPLYQDKVLEKMKEYKNKAALTKLVMESYDYAIQSIEKMDASKMDSLIRRGNYETDQFGWLNKVFEHQTHHRAQTTIYLRLKGIKAPNEKLF
ncbi:DinB family protein [Daejeonella sp.]|jgi:uncharacterized damage-inducible protein DinB|uniref:DinB family protein n=1 Tax=Daejeonella sp. TaxID=2805397 RepID=UPI0037C1571C